MVPLNLSMARSVDHPSSISERERISDMDRHVARRVRQLRVLAGLSMKELASQIGTSYQMLHKQETAKNRISAGRLHAIAQALGVEVAAFFPTVDAREVSPEQAELINLVLRMPEEKQQLMAKLTRAMVP